MPDVQPDPACEISPPSDFGIQRLRTEDLPGYVDLLAYACEKMEWRPQEMRAYRARIEYPIFGTQVRAAFDVPVIDSGENSAL